MKRFVVLDKKVGETPLMALEAWKSEHPEYESLPAAYAGRLDPMASGKLLVLLGDECKRQARYHGLDKEYEVEVLVDLGSDTGDALGLVEASRTDTRVSEQLLAQILKQERGAHVRPYPAYSSKTVNGVPLFEYALRGTLDTIEIPMHEERIHAIRLRGIERTDTEGLRARIKAFLGRVPKTDEPSKALGADFRIDAVRASWDRALSASRNYVILKLSVTCASGTYMRSLAGRIGEALSTNALALSIHRTKIGKYWNGLWLKRY